MKDPVEVQPPGSNSFLVVLCVYISRDRASFAPLGDLPLDLPNSSEIGLKLSPTNHSRYTVLV